MTLDVAPLPFVEKEKEKKRGALFDRVQPTFLAVLSARGGWS
jgi:hypothetical protein